MAGSGPLTPHAPRRMFSVGHAMQAEHLALFEHLDRLELGILFGVLLDSQDADLRLARISAPVGERCLEAYRAVRHLDPASRRRVVLALSRRLFSPMPSNIERIHPSWIRHLLGQESSEVVAVVLPFLPEVVVLRLELSDPPDPTDSVGDLAPQLRQQICRDALAPLADMPPASPRRSAEEPRHLDDLISWSEHRLLNCLTHLGCMVLARLASLTEPPLRQALLDRLPSPYGPKLEQAMAASLPAVEISDPIPAVLGFEMEQQIQHLGIRQIAPGLRSLSRQQLAQRMPRESGMRLLDAQADKEISKTRSPAALQAVVLADRWARGGFLP